MQRSHTEKFITDSKSPAKKDKTGEEKENEEYTDGKWEIEIEEGGENYPVDNPKDFVEIFLFPVPVLVQAVIDFLRTPSPVTPVSFFEKLKRMTISDVTSPTMIQSKTCSRSIMNGVLPFCPFPHLTETWEKDKTKL